MRLHSSEKDRSALVIRRYLSLDHEAVWKLHVSALEAVGARAKSCAAHGLDADLYDIEATYLNRGGEFLVGVADESLVAMGALKRISPSVAEITRMRVDPQYWRRGYGERILHRLEGTARALGYAELWLDTLSVMTAAENLYRKNGFQEYLRVPLSGYEAHQVILFRKIAFNTG